MPQRFRHIVPAFLACLSVAVIAHPATAQRSRQDAFTWSGVMPSQRTLYIRDVNGAIEVGRSQSGRVEVSAEKSWERGNPESVRIEQRHLGEDVIICALWDEDDRCDETGSRGDRRDHSRERVRNYDVSVRFRIRVPDGVRLDLVTVNGGIDVRDVTAAVRSRTVNGSIVTHSTGGPVRAVTVNGSVMVSMGSLADATDLEYETVNGGIQIELPTDVGAQLDLSTVNGGISTDFPIMVSGTLSRRRLRGSVGDGRVRIHASTVNGGIQLRKR